MIKMILSKAYTYILVKSKKLRRTLVKLFLYIMFIIATYSIPKICFNNTFYFLYQL